MLVVQTLALTFDDGPDPDGTPLMLVAEHGRRHGLKLAALV